MNSMVKNVILVVVMVVAIVWAVSSLNTQTYRGENLTFPIGSGPITLTNPSDAPVAAQIVSRGTGSFNVTSSVDGISGNSTRQGTGGASSQLFELTLPSGDTELSVARGNTVTFVATTPVILSAVVNPNTSGGATMILVVAAIVIVVCAYLIGRPYLDKWLQARKTANTPVGVPVVDNAGQGQEIRSYGDNRSR